MKRKYFIYLAQKYKDYLDLSFSYEPLFQNLVDRNQVAVATCRGEIAGKSVKQINEETRIFYDFVPNEEEDYILMVLKYYQRDMEFNKIKFFLMAQPEVKAVGMFCPPYRSCLDYDKIYGAFVYHKSLESKKFDYNLI